MKPYHGSIWSGNAGAYSAHRSARNARHGWDSANEVTEETVGFQLAPRLNALGRLDDPNPAVELLTGFDDEEDRDIALMINQKNDERKEIVQQIYEEAQTCWTPKSLCRCWPRKVGTLVC